jgi:hypothetical protein
MPQSLLSCIVNPRALWWIAVPSNNGNPAGRYREKCKQKRYTSIVGGAGEARSTRTLL